MSPETFVHLRVHTVFSLAEGAIKIPALMKTCQGHQMPAVALTDTGNLFGALEFSLAAAKAGIQPLIGCQLKVSCRPTDPRLQDLQYTRSLPSKHPLDTLVLLVQNERGYRNLLKLISKSYLDQKPGLPLHVTWDDLSAHQEGLLALTGGLEGGVARLLALEKKKEASVLLADLQALFPGRVYMELTRHGLPLEAQLEEPLLELAYAHEVPLVATNECFFMDPEMYEAHDALLCIAEGSYVHQDERRRVTPHHRFKSAEEMIALFQDLPEAILNTQVIAQRCAFMVEPCDPILPPFLTEKGEKLELKEQSERGLQSRLETQVYPRFPEGSERESIKKIYEERLAYELSIIDRMGYNGYFLIVSDFIKWAKKHNIPVGPGRGSGAGSLVAWALTITDVDPIRFGLLFERFLNPERVSLPDFDVDFCQDRRDEVIDYVCEKYGRDRVAQIITFGKLQARAALRDVGRVLGMPYGQVDKICKLIPNNPANPVSLEEAVAQEPQLQEMAQKEPMVAKLLDMGKKIEGLYRHASTHAAGIVIGDRPLDEMVPLYYDGKSSLPATQFHMKHVEMAGLIKFDFLGLKTLSVIQHAVDLVRQGGGELEISSITLEDPKTFELLRNVEVFGVFQVESAGMRDVLRRLQPTRFEELIALVALYRPGPMDDIPRYLACKHGEEPVNYMHPLLEEILKESFGVMVYQEQVMQIAQVLAGYSLGAADLLRRAMGKKIKSEMDAQRRIFIEGAKKNNVKEELASHIFDQISKFAGYGFNKCHSTPYALISYQTAYLKANYPVEFLAASMTFDMNNTDKLTLYRQELDRLKIPLLPPDINKSFERFAVEITPEGQKAIRYALGAIKNVGEGAMRQVVDERQKKGVYKDIFDFARRLDTKAVNKRQLENLIMAGAFDGFGCPRAQLMGGVDTILKYVGEAQKKAQTSQVSLFGEHLADTSLTPKLPTVQPWSFLETSQREFEAIGFYFSAHPLDGYKDLLKRLKLTSALELKEKLEQKESSSFNLAGVVISKKERLSKSGLKYAFVQVSDTTGAFEVTVFSEIFSKTRELLEPGTLLFLRVVGRCEEDSLRLNVQEIRPLEEMISTLPTVLEIKIAQEGALGEVREILDQTKAGKSQIHLILEATEHPISLTLPQLYHITPELQNALASLQGIREVKVA